MRAKKSNNFKRTYRVLLYKNTTDSPTNRSIGYRSRHVRRAGKEFFTANIYHLLDYTHGVAPIKHNRTLRSDNKY